MTTNTNTKTTESQKPTNKPTQTKLDLQSAKLNAAATLLLEQLPDHAGQLVHELAKQYQIPLWQYLGGVLLAVHLEGRLSEFRLDPAWKDGLRTKELQCQYCKKMFKPRHVNQPYCSNECGLAANPPKPHIEEVVRIVPTTGTDRGIPRPNNSSAWTDAPELNDEAA